MSARKPFPVDAEVMAAIRPMQFRDAPRVAALHHAAMGKSLWAQLGLPFLTELYQALVNDPRFLGFVYVEDHEVKGFIAGSLDPDAMMSATLRRAWFLLGPAALPGLWRPSVLRRIIETPRYTAKSRTVSLPAGLKAESLCCSFEPRLRGKRVSGHINKVLFDELLARGHRYVKITTETDNEGANRQLLSWGFVSQGTFRFYGKEMVIYVLDLSTCERVEPVSRHPAL